MRFVHDPMPVSGPVNFVFSVLTLHLQVQPVHPLAHVPDRLVHRFGGETCTDEFRDPRPRQLFQHAAASGVVGALAGCVCLRVPLAVATTELIVWKGMYA